MNEYYTGCIIWQKANSKFTAYLMRLANGSYILRGHIKGTAREADQYNMVPPSYMQWAERAANKFLDTGTLPILG